MKDNWHPEIYVTIFLVALVLLVATLLIERDLRNRIEVLEFALTPVAEGER